MDTERQRHLNARRIALAAVEVTDEEAQALIRAECAGDAALRAEVERLRGTMLDDATIRSDRMEASSDLCGIRVDAAGASEYRISSQLGRGGMGVVYLAERRLGDTVQQVALKLLDTDAGPQAKATRDFIAEGAILASLSHPCIAALLDTGTMADGRPFLAMEYVQGERIDQWCTSRKLSLEARIRLFLKVCAAVQYAHRHLVIHRDLKPANILVTAEGDPKLLDFGIARLLGGDARRLYTQTSNQALTLAYASPEQIRNEPLGTASDVWQLGVVLYELVCDRRPFPQGDSPLGLSNAILAGRVPPPSRVGRMDAGLWMSRPLPADIDAIVLKALRPLPADRYAGVAELADDLRRCLDLRPVLARRGERWYRARCFVARRRAALATGVVILGLLMGFAFERESQLRRIEAERDRAQALVVFLQDMFEHADPSRTRGERITVAEMLDDGVLALAGNTAIEPGAKASLLLSMAHGYTALDMAGRAIPLLDEARQLQHAYGASALERGRVLAALGRAHSMVLDLPSAVRTDLEAIALLEQVPGHDDEILRVRINLLFSDMAVNSIPLPERIAELRSIEARLDARDEPEPELHVQALAALALSLGSAGEDAQAVQAADRALALADRLYGPRDPARLYYGFVRAVAGMRVDSADSLERYRRVIAEYDAVIGRPGSGLAGILGYFGRLLVQIEQHADAAAALERASDISGQFAADAPDFHLGTLASLAEVYVELGRRDEAVGIVRSHRAELRRRAGAGGDWAQFNWNRLKAVEAALGEESDASGARIVPSPSASTGTDATP